MQIEQSRDHEIAPEQRAGRVEWWMWIFASNLIGERLQNLAGRMILPDVEGARATSVQLGLLAASLAGLVLVTLGFQWKATLRRAHDRDGPAWPFGLYAIAVLAVLAVNLWVGLVGPLPFATGRSWIVSLAATAGLIAVFGLRAGDPKPNRWGAPPKPFLSSITTRPDNYRPPRV